MYKDDISPEGAMYEEENNYVKERNKPLPDKVYGAVQSAIIFLLAFHYRKKYSILSELTLSTVPESHTPDVCLYPKRKIEFKKVKAKISRPPLTTIEIKSPEQPIEFLQKKAWDLYFPFGVKSAWIIIPVIKAVQVLTHDDQELFFNSGNVKDPVTGVEISVEKIFEDLI